MSEIIDTLIISDVHLGTSVSRVLELINLIQNTNFHRLILLGDILDSNDLKRLKTKDWQFLYFLKSLVNEKHKDIILIRGNHDNNASKELKDITGITVREEYHWMHHNKKYIAIHGDQFDRVLINSKILNHISPRFYFFFQFLNFRNRLLQIAYQVRRGALKYAEEKGADIIFCGHTHEAQHKIFTSASGKKIEYYNTGCWIKFPSTYITMRGDAISIEKQYSLRPHYLRSKESTLYNFQ